MEAVAWTALLGEAARATRHFDAWAALGFALWAISLADRWLDGVNELPQLLPERHRFWMGQRQLLALMAACAAIGAGWFGWRAASWTLAVCALPAALGAATHVWMVHLRRWRKWPKEAAVGAVFAAGVIAPAAAGLCALPLPLLGAGAILGALCALNCITIEYGEWRSGLAIDEPSPLVRWLGGHASWAGTAIAIVTALASLVAPGWRAVLLAQCVSAAGLAAVASRRWLDVTALAPASDFALLAPAMAAWVLR